MPKVRIYTTLNCPYCKVAKAFFREHNIEFEEVSVESDPKALEEMMDKSGQQGVPVIEVDSEIIVGFNREKLEKSLGIRK